MKKIILSFFLLITFFNLVSAEEYVLTCISDKDFIKVYQIDEDLKSMIHLSSRSLDSDQVWNNINEPSTVMDWSDNLVYTFALSDANIPTYMTFDLNLQQMVSSGHYVDNPDWEIGYAYNQFFECMKG